jgi:putative restriction endonuclease
VRRDQRRPGIQVEYDGQGRGDLESTSIAEHPSRRMRSIIDRFKELNVWQRGCERAPNKPLLVLMALGALSRGQESLSFLKVEPKLRELLKEFGPTRKSVHPEYPFWRLQTDKLWVVSSDAPMASGLSNVDPTVSALRTAHARGEFPVDVRRELRADPEAIGAAADVVLEASFPETLHQDILDAVGLVAGMQVSTKRRRDPNFRGAVLVAYQYRCALRSRPASRLPDCRPGSRAHQVAPSRWP